MLMFLSQDTMESLDFGSLDIGQHCTNHNNRNTGEAIQMVTFSSHVDGMDLIELVSVFLLSLLPLQHTLSHKTCYIYPDTLDHIQILSEDLNVCYQLVFHWLS